MFEIVQKISSRDNSGKVWAIIGYNDSALLLLLLLLILLLILLVLTEAGVLRAHVL